MSGMSTQNQSLASDAFLIKVDGSFFASENENDGRVKYCLRISEVNSSIVGETSFKQKKFE